MITHHPVIPSTSTRVSHNLLLYGYLKSVLSILSDSILFRRIFVSSVLQQTHCCVDKRWASLSASNSLCYLFHWSFELTYFKTGSENLGTRCWSWSAWILRRNHFSGLGPWYQQGSELVFEVFHFSLSSISLLSVYFSLWSFINPHHMPFSVEIQLGADLDLYSYSNCSFEW